jgi:LacI family transcriptional regulator
MMTERGARRKRATLRDVAEATGLSPAGVSYALRGQRVSPETEARVRAEAKRIGFRSDPIARALRGGATGLVGMIGGSLEDFWHQEFASELQRCLRGRGRHMLLADAGGDAAAEIALAESLCDQRVDGLVALPVEPDSRLWLPIVRAVPTVAVGAPLPAPAGAVRFAADAGVDLMVDHLRAAGHRRVLVLATGTHRMPRRPGVRTVRCGFSSADGRVAAHRALDRDDAPTAVFALSDALAYGAYMACADLGLDIPADVAVAGFDDHPLSALVAPPLTSVSWDTAAAAAAAASMLIAAIDGDREAGEVVVPPRLRPRRSTRTQPRTKSA